MTQFDEENKERWKGFAEMILLAVRRCDELVSNLYVCYMIPAWLDNIFLFY